MAVPTYDELLAHYDMEKSIMKQTFNDEDLRQFSLTLDMWEMLARFLGLPPPDIANIKSLGDVEQQRIRMLERWKQRRGSMATYGAMIKALLQISRTDLAEEVITLRQSSKDTSTLETATTNLSTSCPKESCLTAPTSLASSSGIEDASSSAAMSPLSLPATPRKQTTQEVISTLGEFKDGDITPSKDCTKVNYQINLSPSKNSLLLQADSGEKDVPWGCGTATCKYSAAGGRDVLILAPDLSLPHPEAVARRPGQLTEEDKVKLQSQGLPPDCQSEQDIIRARYDLDKRSKIVEVKSGQSLTQEVIESITHLLNTTQNDGGKQIICYLILCRVHLL